MDPERAHHIAFVGIRWAGMTPLLGALLRRFFTRRHTPVQALGRDIPAVFGVAAGFDKNGTCVPGLWRVLDQRAIRNRMGFNNDGAAAAAERLRRLRASAKGRVVVGVNIGKSRATPVDDAAEDYATSARLLAPFADFLVVNVSSPNTPGLRDLQAVELLRPILEAVRTAADEVTEPGGVPLLVKIAPDLSGDELDGVAYLDAGANLVQGY